MTDAVTLDGLRDLPPPDIIETLDYEAILAAMRTDAQARFDAVGVAYTVGTLETDPVMIALQVAAYRELNLRARANDAARANLTRFARGSDLDHKAWEYDVTRLEGESDERLRARIALAIAGRSPGGTAERYEAVAIGVSLRVAEVKAYRIGGGPQLELAVLSTDNGGTPDQQLLDEITSAVTARGVLLVNDTIRVVSAVKTYVDVVVDIWLLPGASSGILAETEARLRSVWTAEAGIGFDLNPSWIAARLHVAGVARVVVSAPDAPVVAADNEAIALQTITVNDRGRMR